jgi:iron complex transport system substrate-binding protein
MRCRVLHLVAGLLPVFFLAGCDKGAPPAAPDAKPLRILSLTPNITEVLFAMGLGDKVVGRSTYCNYPPEAAALPAVGDTMQVGLEKIIRLEPTVAFMVTRRDDVPKRLEGLGIRTVKLQSDRMDQALESIRTIGRETGRPEAAQALIDRIESDLAAVRRRVAGLPRPKVLFAFPMTVGSSRIMVAGRGTFVDELLTAAGAENAYPEKADWPTVGPQQVIAMAPDAVIINATGEDAPPDRVEAIRQAWQSLTSVPAVARGRVHILTETFLTIPGPRVGLAARLLAETIHPELHAEAGKVSMGWHGHASEPAAEAAEDAQCESLPPLPRRARIALHGHAPLRGPCGVVAARRVRRPAAPGVNRRCRDDHAGDRP